MENLFLTIPDKSHEKAYTLLIERWQNLEARIDPELLNCYSSKLQCNVSYSKWLE